MLENYRVQVFRAVAEQKSFRCRSPKLSRQMTARVG